MKFDVIAGNPPYQKTVGPNNNTTPVWHKFVKKSVDICKRKGYITFVHPAGWRNVDGRFDDTQDLILSKDLKKLDMYSEFDAQDKFNVQIVFDVTVIKNKNTDANLTDIKTQTGKNLEKNISHMSFVPSDNFNQIMSLVAEKGEETVEVLYDRSNYGTDKENVNKTEDGEFVHPCVSNVNVDGSLTLYYSNTKEFGHFDVPKLICGKASSGTNFYIDKDGEYGLTQWAYAIVDNPENLGKIKEAMESKEFQELAMSFPRYSQAINRKIIARFRKDFWKEFI